MVKVTSSNLVGTTIYSNAAVAHQVEQQTENLCVAGSSPARGTKLIRSKALAPGNRKSYES